MLHKMKWWVSCLFSIVSLLVGCLPVLAVAAPVSACSLCILEVGTLGAAGQEDQDFVVVANVTTSNITSTSIQLRYYNSKGVLDSALGIGTFTPGQVKVYATDSLKELNPTATKLTLPLFSGGGRLQIARLTTTVYDQVAWGTAVGAEGSAAQAPSPGATLTRRQVAGIVIDTNQNSSDFAVTTLGCTGVEITEIQPFVTNKDGQVINAWVELKGTSGDVGNCRLQTAAGDIFIIPIEDMPGPGQTAVVTSGMVAGQITPLHIGEGTGRVWVTGISTYGSLALPVADVSLGNLVKSQSWARVNGIWHGTYNLTPGEDNVYQPEAVVSIDDANACASVRITELLPNPAGVDTGHEWLEINNESQEPASLAQCIVTVDDSAYYFLPSDVLAADEWRVVGSLYDPSRSEQVVSLRNSDESLVSLLRVRSAGNTEIVQSFTYSNAPEALSWSRFDSGWRWQTPTPGLDNSTAPAAAIGPTEFAAAVTPDDGTIGALFELPRLPVAITELLPNPAAPLSDDLDEFVELYNPNTEPVALKGYKLQTGSSYSYSFTFTDQIIEPGAYLTLRSSQSHLTLSNTAGRARLLDPNGSMMAETDAYADAAEGESWVFQNGVWQWSGSLTPGSDNRVTIPILAAAKSAVKKVSAAPKVTKPKVTPAVKAAKTVKSKTTSPKAAFTQNAKPSAPPIHPLVLAGVGSLAIAYAGYEYRQDMRNKLHQLRSNRATRRSARK